jgi:hypothetical protein
MSSIADLVSTRLGTPCTVNLFGLDFDRARGPDLLHKIQGAMAIRTGQGGRYRYYACATRARHGPTAREGMAIPMGKLEPAPIRSGGGKYVQVVENNLFRRDALAGSGTS